MAFFFYFFFNDTATTEIYTLSLHDALPISDHGGDPARDQRGRRARAPHLGRVRLRAADKRLPLRPALPAVQGQGPPGDLHGRRVRTAIEGRGDRKSTRLNSSHLGISYAVFC